METADKKILVALPTLNEEKAIERMIVELRNCVNLPLAIIDGYSTDTTVQIAKKLDAEVFYRTAGKGYGSAIKKALEVASIKGFDWLLILDCDMTYRPGDIYKLVKHVETNDLIIGVRPMNRISPSHRIANQLHSFLASILFNQPVGDINSGMRMIRVSKFSKKLTEGNMGMVAQISSVAMRNNWAIKEVSIEYDKRVGQSKIDIWDWFVISWCIIRERWRPLFNPN